MTNQDRIAAYFSACSAGSAADISSHFCAEAIVFDTNHKPLVGAEKIGKFWAEVRERWSNAHWYVDTCIDADNAAAIEWTMTGTSEGKEFTVRGSEHYRFEDGLISEIRQYWTFRKDRLDTALRGFPYETRREYLART